MHKAEAVRQTEMRHLAVFIGRPQAELKSARREHVNA